MNDCLLGKVGMGDGRWLKLVREWLSTTGPGTHLAHVTVILEPVGRTSFVLFSRTFYRVFPREGMLLLYWSLGKCLYATLEACTSSPFLWHTLGRLATLISPLTQFYLEG